MENAASDLHIVMLPWPAFGHLIPFYQLSIALAKKRVSVSYVSTPKNIQRLPKIPSDLTPLMQYISLSLPQVSDSNLPQGAEATSWIISDFAAHWMPEVAQECQVPLMYFSVFTATFLSFLGQPEDLAGEGQKTVWPTPDCLTTPPTWSDIFPPSVAFRGYEAAGLYAGLFSKNASGVTDGGRMARVVQGCQAVCIRGCTEFDGDYIHLYQTLVHKPVVPVGLLPPAKAEQEEENITGPWIEIFKWLDQQKSRSVIYVGFGSEYKLTKDEVYEIAYGLELAQLPFIWALRRPTWARDDFEALPPDFVIRTTGKGIVNLGWAPQLKILAHRSIGGSLFHSGWGSIIETLQHGHNLILLPFIIDQGLNARVMVEKGLGIEVQRAEDGSYTKDGIADALRRAMIGDEAQRITTQAKKTAAIFGDHELHEEHYIGRLVEYLTNGIQPPI